MYIFYFFNRQFISSLCFSLSFLSFSPASAQSFEYKATFDPSPLLSLSASLDFIESLTRERCVVVVVVDIAAAGEVGWLAGREGGGKRITKDIV